mgnify:CR=1 FL=1
MGANSNCYLLKVKDCTILLDCPIEIHDLAHFAPKGLFNEIYGEKDSIFKVNGDSFLIDDTLKINHPNFESLDLASIDILLISNVHSMLALPYLTEYYGFNGKIIATEPTAQLGRFVFLFYHPKLTS